MVTLLGTVALALLLVRLMEVPPGPAGPLNVTVPVLALPPRTDEGESVTETSVLGVIVSFAL